MIYYRDDNDDGIEDYSMIPAEKPKGYRFDTANDRWEPLLDIIVDKAEKRVYIRTLAFSDFALGGPIPKDVIIHKCSWSVSAGHGLSGQPVASLAGLILVFAAFRRTRGPQRELSKREQVPASGRS